MVKSNIFNIKFIKLNLITNIVLNRIKTLDTREKTTLCTLYIYLNVPCPT